MKIFLAVTFIACILGNVCNVKASKLDSLVNRLDRKMSDKDRIDLLWQIVKKTYRTDPDQGRYYSNKLKALAVEKNDDLAKARAIWIIARIDDKEGQFVEALEGYFEALYLYKNLDVPVGIAAALNNIATLYDKGYEYHIALSFYHEALPYYVELNNNEKLTKAHFYIATIYKNIKEYETARQHLDTVIALSQKHDLTDFYTRSFNLEGNISFEEGNYKKARENYQKYLELGSTSEKKAMVEAIAYNNIGETYMEEGDLDLAYDYLDRSFKIREVLGKKTRIAYTLNVLGKLMLKKKNDQEAFTYFQKAVSLLDGKSLNNDLYVGLKNIHDLIKSGGERMEIEHSGKLLSYTENLKKLKEALEVQNIKYMLRMATISAQLKHEKRLHEAKVKKYTRIGTIAGSVFLLFIMVLYMGNKRKKKMLKKEAAIYDAEKDDLEKYEKMNGFD